MAEQTSWLMAQALEEMRELQRRLALDDQSNRPNSIHAAGRPILTCACCGEKYVKGHWKCCAPPGGQTAARYLELWHQDCPTSFSFGPGKRRCPRHCGCARLADGRLTPEAKQLSIEETKAAVNELRRGALSGRRTSSLPAEEEDPEPRKTSSSTEEALFDGSDWDVAD